MYSQKSTLAMSCGTCLHKALEVKGRYKIDGKPIDYPYLKDICLNGIEEKTEKGSEYIKGFNQLEKEFFEDFYEPCAATGMNYNEKLKLFFTNVLPTRMEDAEWKVIGVEVPFEFVYNNRVLIKGFIDRIDENVQTGELKVVDYKSSKKIYPESSIKTSLQHFIYDMACIVLYDKLPKYHEYDFILLDKKQDTSDGVCSKGYIGRGIKKIDKILDSIQECEKEGIYKPSPSPLCYWCSFNSSSPNGDRSLEKECEYHSLWTPSDKNFKVKKEWTPESETSKKRSFNFLDF